MTCIFNAKTHCKYSSQFRQSLPLSPKRIWENSCFTLIDLKSASQAEKNKSSQILLALEPFVAFWRIVCVSFCLCLCLCGHFGPCWTWHKCCDLQIGCLIKLFELNSFLKNTKLWGNESSLLLQIRRKSCKDTRLARSRERSSLTRSLSGRQQVFLPLSDPPYLSIACRRKCTRQGTIQENLQVQQPLLAPEYMIFTSLLSKS